jgi:hypothetical protein
MKAKNRIRLTLLAYALFLVIGCAVVSYGVGRWFACHSVGAISHGNPTSLVNALDLNSDEQSRLAEYDKAYKAERAVLLAEFNQRIAHISELLCEQDSYSDEVSKAVNELHHVHGQLQKLSIEHYYDILQVLPPDKREKLRDIAVTSLSQPE